MIYFYLWVVVLAVIVFAVPVAVFLEKSRNKKEAGPVEAVDENAEAGDAMDESAAGAEIVEDDMSAFGESIPAGADDFSAFDDFK